MGGFNEKFRFYGPIVLLGAFVCLLVVRLSMLHFGREAVKQPEYFRTVTAQALRGGIYPMNGGCAFASSVPVWNYYADPAAAIVNKGKNSRTRQQLAEEVAKVMGLPEEKVRKAFYNTNSRYNFLLTSIDGKLHEALTKSPGGGRPSLAREAGLAIEERQIRMNPQGSRLAHVVGFVSRNEANRVGAAGIEAKYEKYLHGIPGLVREYHDARGRTIYDRPPVFSSPPQNGCDVYLTVDQNIQFDVESALAEGVKTHQARAGWAIVMDVKTGAVLAMANLPTYDLAEFNKCPPDSHKNRAISESYEPGSVMKTVTACAVLNENMAGPDTMVNTAHNDPNYYRLPKDAGHKWEAFMSVRDALVHSSNIVFGKLGVNLGPKRLWSYMMAFGLGKRTDVGLPGEETGIIPKPENWDKVKWSRAPIGQGVAVTAIQMASAYATIANDGKRMQPYIVDRIVSASGETVYKHEPKTLGEPIRPEVARQVREMLIGVAKKGGTAKRAAVKGYSVAGKTGTAQMREGKGYSEENFNASFIGMVPADKPEIVILVTLQRPEFCRSYKKAQETGLSLYNHQGGVCAAPTFRAIAEKVVRYLGIPPDRPEELSEEETKSTR